MQLVAPAPPYCAGHVGRTSCLYPVLLGGVEKTDFFEPGLLASFLFGPLRRLKISMHGAGRSRAHAVDGEQVVDGGLLDAL